MTRSRKWKIAAVAALCTVYVLLRVRGMADSCLWFDEVFSIHAALHPWNELFSFVALDLIHPPLFYVLLKGWISIGGDGLIWTRTFPVVWSIFAIAPFLFICRELKLPTSATLMAFLLFAVNGPLIKYAQEVRMYSLLLFVSLCSVWLFSRYFFRGKSLVALIIVNVVMVYVHYYGWLVIGAEVFAVLLFQRIKIRAMLLMAAVSAAAFAPWLYAVVKASQASTGLTQNIGWMEAPGFITVLRFLLSLNDPLYFTVNSTQAISNYVVSVPMLLIGTVAAALYFSNAGREDADERRKAFFLIAIAGVPAVLAFVLSWILPYSIWGIRHLIVVFGPYFLLFGLLVSRVGDKRLRTAAILLVILFAGYGVYGYSNAKAEKQIWCAWEEFALFEKDKPTNLYLFEDLSAYHTWFARRHFADGNGVFKITGIEGMVEDTAYFLPRGFDGVDTIDINEITDERLAIAFRAENWNLLEEPLRSFVSRGYTVADRQIVETGSGKAYFVMLKKAGK